MTNKKSVDSVIKKGVTGKPAENKKKNKTIEKHVDSAKYYEAVNKENAAVSKVLAYGHNAIAGEFVSDDAKHHSQILKRTNSKKKD